MERAKDKLKDLLKDATPKGELIPFPGAKVNRGQHIEIKGANAQVAGRDIVHHHHNERTVKKNVVVRGGPGYIDSTQAAKIRALVKDIVTREAAAGVLDGNMARLFAKWWGFVQGHFDVPSYLEIPSHLGEEALAWLRQQKATGRRKYRRADPDNARNELYAAIWARSKSLQMAKADVYALAAERLGTRVTSLKRLSDRNLQSLYDIVMAKGR